jgi:hypothetical protein
MARAPQSVEAFLDGLDHTRLDDVRDVRAALLTIDGVTERVKWNAPSLCIGGDDRITFRLQPGHRVDLVLHRGSRTRADADTFSFDDPSGLVTWSTPDRGVIVFPAGAAVADLLPRVLEVASAWLAATHT